MTGILTSLQNAVSGLTTTKAGNRVVSENLANASVDGYHTRSAEIASQRSARAGAVTFQGVERAKASALTANARVESGRNAELQARVDLLRGIGESMGDPKEEKSLGGRVAAVEKKLRALASNPGDAIKQREALAAAKDATSSFNRLSEKVQTARERADRQIDRGVADVNKALEKVHQLNDQIARAEQTSAEANTLMDERSRAIDRVAEALNVEVKAASNGRVDLYTDKGLTLLDEENGPADLTFDRTPNMAADKVYAPSGAPSGKTSVLSGLKINGVDVTPTRDDTRAQAIEDGRLAGLFKARDQDLVNLQNQLDRVAEDMVLTFQDFRQDTNDTDVSFPIDNVSGLGTSASGGDPVGQFDLTDTGTDNQRITIQYKVGGNNKEITIPVGPDGASAGSDSNAFAENVRNHLRNLSDFGDGSGGSAIEVSNNNNTVKFRTDTVSGDTGILDIKIRQSGVDPTTGYGEAERQGLFVDTRKGADQPYPTPGSGPNSYASTAGSYTDGEKVGLAGDIAVNEKVKNDPDRLRAGAANEAPANVPDGYNEQVFRFADAFTESDRSTTVEGDKASLIGATESIVASFQAHRGEVATDAEAAKTALDKASEARTDAIAVDQDKQMQRLLELEKTYQTNARVVQTTKRMFDELLSATR